MEYEESQKKGFLQDMAHINEHVGKNRIVYERRYGDMDLMKEMRLEYLILR